MSGEDSWVFDSLVCFLHGPIWNAPLQTFIEEKSLIFDANEQPEEDDADIKRIHEDYKNMVDYMLGSFMEEMHITPEQFELACMEGRNQKAENPLQIHQGLFQQIWAANDIKMFTRMMTQRNVELQLQALDLIEKNQLAFLKDSEELHLDDQKHKYVEVEKLIAKSVERELDSPEATLTQENEIAETTDKFQRLNLFFEKNKKVNPDEVLSRQEYLRQQRDKIVEIKKQTRAKQLQDTVDRIPVGNGRPTSAQVAQKLLETGAKTNYFLVKNNAEGNEQRNKEKNSALQLRRTLAERLRSEVVDQNEK